MRNNPGDHDGTSLATSLEGSSRRRPDAWKALGHDVHLELLALARKRLEREGHGQELQTSDLVNEAWLALRSSFPTGFDSRAHLLSLASRAMRNVLIDRARRDASSRRLSPQRRLSWSEVSEEALSNRPRDLTSLGEGLEALTRASPRQGRLVHLVFFEGLSMAQAARRLGVSTATAKRDWRLARRCLRDIVEEP